jgi:hypothetical protein
MRAKVGALEYSVALPRAESAEAAGSFRDQRLTGDEGRWRQGVPPASASERNSELYVWNHRDIDIGVKYWVEDELNPRRKRAVGRDTDVPISLDARLAPPFDRRQQARVG